MRKLDISVIGVPLDYGQSRRGVDMGPSAMRYAGVMKRLEAIGHNLKDEGDVPVSAVEQKDGEITNLKNLKEVVQATSELANRVAEVVRKGNFPLVLGGDHSIAIGTIAGLVLEIYKSRCYLVRCPCRHEYSGNITFRQYSWYAACCTYGNRS